MIPPGAPFYRLLRRLEAGYHEFLDADAVEDFGPHWAAYRAAGFVGRAAPAAAARCPDCLADWHPVEPLGRHALAIWCPDCGQVPVPPGDLSRSRLNLPVLLGTIGRAAVTADAPAEVTSGVWRLGPIRSGLRSKEVFVAATLDPSRLRAAAAAFSGRRPVLFFPTAAGAAAWTGPPGPLVAPLTEYLDADGAALRFDHASFAALMRGDRVATVATVATRPRKKRADRAEKIERLTELMTDHMTLAHARAVASMSRHGYVDLLPRPTQKQLAERLTTSESSVSRCLNDRSPAGRALKKLWGMSINPHDVLQWRHRR